MHVGIVVALAAHSRALERSYMSKHGTPGSFFNTSPTDAPDSLKSDTHSTNTGVLSELVQILKALQIYSMGVDTDLSPEENVEYLTNYLHWAEVQIEKLHSQALQRIVDNIENIEDPYPKTLFIPITSEQWAEINDLLTEHMGFPIDRVSGNLMGRGRKVGIHQVKAILKEAIG